MSEAKVAIKENVKVLLPLNGRILLVKDDDKDKTKGGIILPDNAKIDVLTGRIIEIAEDVKNNDNYKYMRKLDRVIVSFYGAVPVDLEPGNKHYLIPAVNVMGVYRDADDLPDEEE